MTPMKLETPILIPLNQIEEITLMDASSPLIPQVLNRGLFHLVLKHN